MAQKFECKECGKKFSSEGKGQIKCPHCGSDNIEYASLHIPYKYVVAFICLVLAALIFYKYSSSIYSFLSHEKGETEITDTISCGNGMEDSLVDNLNGEIEELGITIPPTIKGLNKMEIDDEGNYDFIVKTDHTPTKGYSVVITDVKTNKLIAKSNDGIFKGVPFSKNDGKYYAQIVNSSTNEPLSELTEITGFIEVKSISKKLSTAELQNLINKRDPSLLGHDNEYLSPVYKIKYTSLPKGSDYAPDNLADVFEMIDFGAWTGVEVSSLEYDETKHISSITLKVKAASQSDFDN